MYHDDTRHRPAARRHAQIKRHVTPIDFCVFPRAHHSLPPPGKFHHHDLSTINSCQLNTASLGGSSSNSSKRFFLIRSSELTPSRIIPAVRLLRRLRTTKGHDRTSDKRNRVVD